jgi:hypothetical protein
LVSNGDNTTPSADNGSWTAFGTPGNDVSDNVSWNLTITQGMQQIFVWVKNSMDNVSLSGTDNITLDTVKPEDNATTQHLLTGSVDDNGTDVDNRVYTDNATVTLDNLTSWVFDNGSGIATGQYYLSDNSSDNVTLSSRWMNLDNLTFTIGSDWNGNGAIGNTTTLDNKTFYVWTKDNASNISDNYSMVTIFFDNVSPVLSFTLDNGTGDNTSYTSNATVDLNLTSATDNGSGVMEYFYIESATAPTAPTYTSVASNYGNASGWTTDNKTSWTFDNGTNEQKTVYIFGRDKAGNVNTGSSASIVFDNTTPVIDNLTLAPAGFTFSGIAGDPFNDQYATSASVTLYLSANDNETNNFSSGWSEIKWSYTLTRSTQSDNWTNTEAWQPIRDNISVNSDNLSFDNASWTLALQFGSGAFYPYFDNTSTTTDNLSVTVYLKDNASNVVSYTSIFELDNSTIFYNQ